MPDEDEIRIIKTGKLEIRVTPDLKLFLQEQARLCGFTFPEYITLCIHEGSKILADKYIKSK